MKNKIITLFVVVLIITSTILIACDKPNIETATIEELQEINGIGEVLSLRIVSYLKSNKNATIDNLSDIKGIGEVKLELIRKEFD